MKFAIVLPLFLRETKQKAAEAGPGEFQRQTANFRGLHLRKQIGICGREVPKTKNRRLSSTLEDGVDILGGPGRGQSSVKPLLGRTTAFRPRKAVQTQNLGFFRGLHLRMQIAICGREVAKTKIRRKNP